MKKKKKDYNSLKETIIDLGILTEKMNNMGLDVSIFKLINDTDKFLDYLIYSSENLEKNYNYFEKIFTNNYVIYENIYNILNNNTTNKFIFDLFNHYLSKKIINRKKDFSIKYFEALSIVNSIALDTYNNLSDVVDFQNNETYFFDNKNDLRPIENTALKYVGYSFSKNSNISVNEAFEKSIVFDISELGNCICNKMKTINMKKVNFFGITEDSVDLALYIKDIVEDEKAFSYLINLFFKVVYENSGTSDNRIYDLSNKCNNDELKELMDRLKHIRKYYDHTTRHLSKKDLSEVKEFMLNAIGIENPIKKSDWVKVQKQLYEDINRMLDIVIELL